MVDAAGRLHEFPLPTPDSAPYDITTSPSGTVWFTEGRVNRIGEISDDGRIREIQLEKDRYPEYIASAVDGTIWFTEPNVEQVGRIDTEGRLSEFKFKGAIGPITTSPDGRVWFVLGVERAEYIAGFSPNHSIVRYKIPPPYSGGYGLIFGPDHSLWLTDPQGNRILKMAFGGAFTLYNLPSASSDPGRMASDGKRYLWFRQTNAIGRISTAGVVAEFPNKDISECVPCGLALGDRVVWSTIYDPSAVVRVGL